VDRNTPHPFGSDEAPADADKPARSDRPQDQPHDGPSLAAIGALAVVMILCCAAVPLLLGAGALAVVSTTLRTPYLIGIAALITIAGIAFTAYRRHHRSLRNRR